MGDFLDVRDLRKRYGRTVALDGVSFQVAPGELFGLLGPNGAGKSTLIAILSCLLTADGGRATLLGEDLAPANAAARRLIGIVPQDLAIYPDLTGRENLTFFGKLYGLGGPNLRKRVDQVLEAVALLDRADDRAGGFSGGMKRRLNLGAALVHQPRILFLDEPTVGVDPHSRNHIFEGVRRLNAAGTTVIYTSHYMEEVQALCSRVGILDHGRLIACDTLPSLLQTLDGVIRFRVPAPAAGLSERLTSLPARVQMEDGIFELHAAEVQPVLTRLLGLLNDQNVHVADLTVQEPNLERVFLHLTGRALRD
ncbi:MAG TPA: ABC transporter ATP-binding protein [Gemmataceae bacterium]|jgi:ABC-2 type transport system ATP-binding protein|nr:ABC transporter ATP-binding protein [Gemmataceae bacterium]